MKKMKIVSVVLMCLALVFGMTACGGGGEQATEKSLDLTGEYVQTEDDRPIGSYYTAEIENDVVTVYLIDETDNNEEYVSWVGTYTAPNDNPEKYSWISKPNKEAMKGHFFASNELEELEFIYENNLVSFPEIEMVGEEVTRIIKLEKQ